MADNNDNIDNKDVPMYECCNEDFKTTGDYLAHRIDAHTDDVPGAKRCRVCKVVSADYAKSQRTCRDCQRHGFRLCTGCNTVKLKSDFYRDVNYGKCAACRSGKGAEYKPRARVFDSVPRAVLEDIYARLELRRQWIESDGAEGDKGSFTSMAKAHGIKTSNFHAWLRAGKLHPYFARGAGAGSDTD